MSLTSREVSSSASKDDVLLPVVFEMTVRHFASYLDELSHLLEGAKSTVRRSHNAPEPEENSTEFRPIKRRPIRASRRQTCAPNCNRVISSQILMFPLAMIETFRSSGHYFGLHTYRQDTTSTAKLLGCVGELIAICREQESED